MLSWLAKTMIARNMAKASEGEIELDTLTGERVYENRYVIWGTIRWGLVRDYEDTEKSCALDEYLAANGDPLSQQAIGGTP